jgi:hypothetical protein
MMINDSQCYRRMAVSPTAARLVAEHQLVHRLQQVRPPLRHDDPAHVRHVRVRVLAIVLGRRLLRPTVVRRGFIWHAWLGYERSEKSGPSTLSEHPH